MQINMVTLVKPYKKVVQITPIFWFIFQQFEKDLSRRVLGVKGSSQNLHISKEGKNIQVLWQIVNKAFVMHQTSTFSVWNKQVFFLFVVYFLALVFIIHSSIFYITFHHGKEKKNRVTKIKNKYKGKFRSSSLSSFCLRSNFGRQHEKLGHFHAP